MGEQQEKKQAARPVQQMHELLTICNLMVLPSSSMVRIFCVCIERERRVSRQHTLPYTPLFPSPPRAASLYTYKVDADGGDVALGVRVVREPQQQAGFPHARVPNQQELKQVVAGVGGKWMDG